MAATDGSGGGTSSNTATKTTTAAASKVDNTTDPRWQKLYNDAVNQQLGAGSKSSMAQIQAAATDAANTYYAQGSGGTTRSSGGTTQATQNNDDSDGGPTSTQAYNFALAYKTYIDTLAILIKQTGQIYTFNGLDAANKPIFTPLFKADGTPERTQEYALTEAQINKYAADIVVQKAQASSEYAAQASKLTSDTGFVHMYKGNNADGTPIIERQTDAQGKPMLSTAYQKQLFDANLTRQQALATMIANPMTYVAGASLANQMGARMGSTPVVSGPSYVLANGVGGGTSGNTGGTSATTATNAASVGTGVGTASGVSAMGANTGTAGGTTTGASGYPSIMPSAPTGADAMSGRSAVSLDVSPSMMAALGGTRVSASGNPTGVAGGVVNLPDATPLSGDFGKINIADWRRMNDTTQKQYASLALANQPGLTSDDLTKRIAAQAPGTAAWS